jgi:hypothetical protein
MVETTRCKPGRRRRWLAISALVLLAFGVVGWVFRPYADPRFVGRWIEHEGEVNEATWTFHSDGRLDIYTWSRRAGGMMVTLPYRWFVVGERFYHSPLAGTAGQSAISFAGYAWRVLSNQAASIPVVIEQATTDQLVLRPMYAGPKHDAQKIRLRRHHEDSPSR